MLAFYENKTSAFYCRDIEGHILECAKHLHYNLEIAFVYEGQTEVSIDNAPSEIALGGDVIVVFPNQVHAFLTQKPERHILLIADPASMPEFSSLFTEHLPTSNIIRGAAKDKELCAIIETISKIYARQDTPHRDTILKGYLLAFVGRLFGMMKFRRAGSEDIHAIGNVMNYCIAHYSEELSLSSLEKKLHMSKYYISHIMNRQLNMGFNDYVNSIRVSNACRLLAESDMQVAEICDSVGFRSVRTFNRAFAKHTGMSPRQYRSRSKFADGAGQRRAEEV